MFYTLRRIVIGVFFLFVAGVAMFVYRQRAVFYPVADFTEAVMVRNEVTPKIVGPVTGRVVKVTDGSSFQMRPDGEPLLYAVTLSGLKFPSPTSTNKIDVELREQGRSALSELVLSNRVEVTFTFLTEKRNGLGIVSVGQTNVNAALVESGLAKANRDYLKGMPFKHVYRLIRAERRARQNDLGIWKREEQLAQLRVR